MNEKNSQKKAGIKEKDDKMLILKIISKNLEEKEEEQF